MTRKEIIEGLKFTVEMFLFDPDTGKTYSEPRNDMDKTTIDACKGAIELLERPKGKWIDREVVPVDEMAFDEWQQEQCSECKKWHTTPYMYYFYNYNYCPYCGADMRKTKR